jgi:hypothetical protein
MRDFLFTNFCVVSPYWLMPGQKTTVDDLQEKINRFWSGDPVHPSEETFAACMMPWMRQQSPSYKKSRPLRKLCDRNEAGGFSGLDPADVAEGRPPPPW